MARSFLVLSAVPVLALLASYAPARAQAVSDGRPRVAADHYFGQAEGSLSLVAQTDDAPAPGFVTRTYGLAVRAGRRWDDLALFGTLEGNLWHSPLLEDDSELAMTTSLGIGGEVLSAKRRVRTSLAVGAAMLVVPTAVDEGGEVGVFLDLRPLGLRFPLEPAMTLGFDPLSFTVLMPVLSGIPLVEIEFRTAVYLEYVLP